MMLSVAQWPGVWRPCWRWVLTVALGACLICSTAVAEAESGAWRRAATGQDLEWRVVQSPAPGASVTVIRFRNARYSALANRAASIAAAAKQLKQAGYRIIEIERDGHLGADFPLVAHDIAQLRDDLLRNALFKELELDASRIFILPEDFALKTDVVYYDDATRPLRMDIAYPADADGDVPCLLEFSCDNENRMGNYSLVACRDTILESFAFAGYAFAMVDHPVAPPYKGIDAMPDSGYKVKAAVRTLRGEGQKLGLSGKIGAVGFSRGSGMALLLATTEGIARFEGKGRHSGQDSSVQAAVVLSGRFTYLDLLPNDHMLPRYIKAWGERERNREIWKEHGALDYLDTPTFPLFLSINSGEGRDAHWQMMTLRKRLAELGNDSIFIMDRDGQGHKVPIDRAILDPMRFYFDQQLRTQ